MIGRAGSTFGDPEAAAKGDTSAETQFKKGPGDFSADTGGSGVKDIGDTVCALSCALSCRRLPACADEAASIGQVYQCISVRGCCGQQIAAVRQYVSTSVGEFESIQLTRVHSTATARKLVHCV